MRAALAALALGLGAVWAGACGGHRAAGASVTTASADFGQETPRRALRTFVHAAELGRFDVLLELAPASARAGLTPESLRARWEGPAGADRRALLTVLRGLLDAPIAVFGDEAFLPYRQPAPAGQRVQVEGEVRFAREESAWKIAEAW